MKNRIVFAHRRISPYIRETSCDKSFYLSQLMGGDVFIKQEQTQVSGSFKIRGVLNKVIKMIDEDNSLGFVAASTGNHGIAFGAGLSIFNLEGKVWVPETIVTPKREALEASGVEVSVYGKNCIETEKRAREEAVELGKSFIHPYNDIDVVAGQGTVGIEIASQMGNPDYVLVPVGGGGLISGIAAIFSKISPKTKVIGCQPFNSQVMKLSLEEGKILKTSEGKTISDATAGGVESGSITFKICQDLVKDILLLEEEEICEAIRTAFKYERIVLEGGAALPVAALMKYPSLFKGKKVALVTTGNRIEEKLLKKILYPVSGVIE